MKTIAKVVSNLPTCILHRLPFSMRARLVLALLEEQARLVGQDQYGLACSLTLDEWRAGMAALSQRHLVHGSRNL